MLLKTVKLPRAEGSWTGQHLTLSGLGSTGWLPAGFLEARPQKLSATEAEGADRSWSRETSVLVGLVLGSAANWLCMSKSTALSLFHHPKNGELTPNVWGNFNDTEAVKAHSQSSGLLSSGNRCDGSVRKLSTLLCQEGGQWVPSPSVRAHTHTL